MLGPHCRLWVMEEGQRVRLGGALTAGVGREMEGEGESLAQAGLLLELVGGNQLSREVKWQAGVVGQRRSRNGCHWPH